MRTKEQIMEAVKLHHNYVAAQIKPATVLMTVLIGSQNYNIEHKNSDIDTYSFVLPSLRNIAHNNNIIDTEYEMDDGKCCVKDIRTALNLLMKTNPNSIEWFCSNYIIYNPDYNTILRTHLCKANRKNILYCNIHNMGNACKGMSLQLKNRNMPLGKKYAHALRILSMWKHYINCELDNILSFTDNESRREAFSAKIGGLGLSDEDIQAKIDGLAIEIANLVNSFNDVNLPTIETVNKKEIRDLQEHLFMRHVTLELAKEFERGCQIW